MAQRAKSREKKNKTLSSKFNPKSKKHGAKRKEQREKNNKFLSSKFNPKSKIINHQS